MIDRQNAFRRTHGADAIHDILYVDQMRDPIGEMRRLYTRFDTPFTAAAEAAMTRLLAEQPKGKHGAHHYTLEELGLIADGVRERFGDYCTQFGL